MPTILFAAPIEDWPAYGAALPPALARSGVAGARLVLPGEAAPESVDYIVFAPGGPVSDFAPFARAKAALSLFAGVERIIANPTLTMPLCRMVDEGLERGMVEWTLGQVLTAHLGLDRVQREQDGIWRGDRIPPLATERRVTVLGLGALGRACALRIAAIGFRVTGWSRSPKQIDGIDCLSGPEGLETALTRAEILLTILPATPETQDLLDARRLALLPMGATVINPGRGTLIDDQALLAALDAGRVGRAVLDVFRAEPLPPDHPYWAHPQVTVSPHVAAATRPETASRVLAENIRRGEAGLPFLHLVDRARGY